MSVKNGVGRTDTIFFRMPYAESLFVCAVLAVLYGMVCRWPLILLAVVAGFVTAIRAVGVAVTAAFLWYVLTDPDTALWLKSVRAMFLAPLACWGLLSFILYQELAFGTIWAFAQTQEHWSLGIPGQASWDTKVWSLLTLEPAWNVYVPSSPRYWENVESPGGALLNVMFWNPILFLLAAALLVVGGWKRWLVGPELVLGTCLLAIPYLTRAYEMSMGSHARFAAVVVVNYLVLGRLLTGVGRAVRIAFCGALAVFLGLFAFSYAAHYSVF